MVYLYYIQKLKKCQQVKTLKLSVPIDKETEKIQENIPDTKYIKLYDIADNRILCSEIVGTMGCDPEQLVNIAAMFESDALICSNIPESLADMMEEEGIYIFSGYSGDSDEAVEKFLQGK